MNLSESLMILSVGFMAAAGVLFLLDWLEQRGKARDERRRLVLDMIRSKSEAEDR